MKSNDVTGLWRTNVGQIITAYKLRRIFSEVWMNEANWLDLWSRRRPGMRSHRNLIAGEGCSLPAAR